MAFVARVMNRYVARLGSSMSTSHFIGWWLQCGGHYEESIPHLEDAILVDLDDLANFAPYSKYLPMDAPAVLLRSYRRLAPAKDWREICDRLPKPGRRRFLDRLCDKILSSNKPLSHFILKYIKDRLHNLITRFFSPKKTAQIYFIAAEQCLQSSSFRRSATCLRLAIQCLDPEDPVWHCKSCVAGLANLVNHMPSCIQENIVRDLDARTAFEVIIREVARYISGEVRESGMPVFCPKSLSGDDVEEPLGYETASKAFVVYFSSFCQETPILEPECTP